MAPRIHFKGLNSLRFFAALFVVIGHVPLNQASLGLPHPSYGALFFRGELEDVIHQELGLILIIALE